ncbi:MAG: 50S ribosomal protein L17 [Candidatus Omnitrophica bacterium]|nr:50S ribosomal protein L17 [Candidatus Omnitrophota bacterium]
MKRHRLNRRTAWRTATVRSLVQSLIIKESIKTTLARAKAARPVAEKLISWAKDNSIEKKRLAFATLGDHSLVSLLFSQIGPRFKDRAGGFTRILRLENRRGDDAQMALFQLTQLKEKEKKEKARKHEDTQAKPEKQAEKSDKQPKPASGAKEPEAKPEPQAPKKTGKPPKKFLGGIRSIFKKERDSL